MNIKKPNMKNTMNTNTPTDGKAGYDTYFTAENIKKAYDNAVAGWDKKTANEKAKLTFNESDYINLK